jgi:hypothetical protein
VSDERCRPLVDDSGEVVASVRSVSELDERGRTAMLEIVAAARKLDAANETPERRGRQAVAIARIRERAARIRGEVPTVDGE